VPPIVYTPAEILAIPTTGAYLAAWNRMKTFADGPMGAATMDQNSNVDTNTLAAALVGVRLNSATHLNKAKQSLRDHIGLRGYALEIGRNLPPLLIAADIMGFREQAFVDWMTFLRTATGSGSGTGYGAPDTADNSIQDVAYNDPTNWGTMNMACLLALDLYLGNSISAHANRFHDYLGQSSSGWKWEETAQAYAWQVFYPTRWTVLPVGATKSGINMSGCAPEDARRAPFPQASSYNQEAFQGTILSATILAYQGYPVSTWNNGAIGRMYEFITNSLGMDWIGDDVNSPWMVNYVMGTSYATTDPAVTRGAKNFGFAAWTHTGTVATPPPPPPTPGTVGEKRSAEAFAGGTTYGAARSGDTWTGTGGGFWGAVRSTLAVSGGAGPGNIVATTRGFLDASNGGDTDGTVFTLTPTSNVPSGSRAMLAIQARQDGTPSVPPAAPSVSGHGLTWTQLPTNSPFDYDTSGATKSAGYVFIGTGTPTSGALTITFGSTVHIVRAVLDSATNLAASPVVQSAKTAANTTGTSNAPLLGTFADPTNNMVWHAAWHDSAGNAMTVKAGFTALGTAAGGGQNARLQTQWREGADTTPTFTWLASLVNGGIAVELDKV